MHFLIIKLFIAYLQLSQTGFTKLKKLKLLCIKFLPESSNLDIEKHLNYVYYLNYVYLNTFDFCKYCRNLNLTRPNLVGLILTR